MSRCARCGKELMTGDSHWEQGLCNQCWNVQHYSVDEIRDTLNKCEEKYKDVYKQLAEKDKEIRELKTELEIYKQRIEELADQRENLYEETKILNSWKETYYQYYQEFKHKFVVLKKALLKANQDYIEQAKKELEGKE